MNRQGISLALLIVVVYAFVFYFSLSTGVSWDSRGEFNHLANVTAPGKVVVDMPPELELISGVYPELDYHGQFEDSLKSAMAEVLESETLYSEFAHVRPVMVFPGEGLPSRINNSVVIIFVPFYGHENRVYYENCYASILVYMNSNGDVGSYLSVEEKYSGDSRKTDDLQYFAADLFRTAKARADLDGSPYSLKVVYWNVLEVRRGKLADKSCWDILAGEVGKEIQEWARTLRPSDEP
ncbi:hypothetical protein [Thermococcus thioreducens]|uniref:Uncharacterized protein n=1 Tax=Thermococcus thioreducens TaxID=277988 RepID=A0A0Q2RG55_9EURY|nr:hypothetical protein [Thermococcus thioreducens]ASJ12267.1 hypothetical protein A3L14_04905 [Thermococcus thioreducens]KQH83006.1 hypothetical protein AMR53_01900 [Thermococcus thioreducens]SEV93843.1 hypothetical protein SAMN05216170_0986 [Thermococcus thioreducens]